ncbi:unnamed protein product [Parajaminaea phylloscopi]
MHQRGLVSGAYSDPQPPSGFASRCDSIFARYLVMAARWAPGSSAIHFAQATGSRIENIAGIGSGSLNQTQSIRFSEKRDGKRRRTLLDECIDALLQRSLTQQAATLLDLWPTEAQTLHSYVALLKHFGEADLAWTADTRSYQSRRPRPPSIAYHRRLWMSAVGFTDSLEPGGRSEALWRLYGARMISHARHQSTKLVEHDLLELQSLGDARVSSDGLRKQDVHGRNSGQVGGAPLYTLLPLPAQVALVQTFARAGRDADAMTHARAIVQEWRRLHGPEGLPRHLGSALLNTLIASAVPKGSRGLSRSTSGPSSTSRRASRVDTTLVAAGHLQGLLSRHDTVSAELRLQPDLVTRNIILAHLLRWLCTPAAGHQHGRDELLRRCIYNAAPGEADLQDTVANSSGSKRQLAKRVLKYQSSMLRSSRKILFDRGDRECAGKLVGLLKEREIWAERVLGRNRRPGRRSIKGRASTPHPGQMPGQPLRA